MITLNSNIVKLFYNLLTTDKQLWNKEALAELGGQNDINKKKNQAS